MRTVLASILIATVSTAAWASDAASARKLVDQKKYDKAVAAASKLTKADPGNVDAWLVLIDGMLGQCDALDGEKRGSRLWETVEQAEKAVERNGKSVKLHVKFGDLYQKLAEHELRGAASDANVRGFFTDARMRYEQALKLDPKSADAAFGASYCRYWAGEPEKGLAGIKDVLAKNPNHAPSHVFLGGLAFEGRRWNEAMIHYEKARSLDDSDPQVCLRYGLSLHWGKQFDKAKAAYKYALKRHPTVGTAIRTGLQSLVRNDYAKLAAELKEWEKEIKNSPPLYFYIGYAELQKKKDPDLNAALRAFQSASKLDPQNSFYPYYAGYVHERKGDAKKAMEGYAAALKLDPAHRNAAGSYERLIRALHGRDFDELERQYDKLIALAHKEGWVHNNFALTLRDWAERNGARGEKPPTTTERRIKKSGKVYEMAAKLLPNEAQVQSDTGLLYEFYPCNRNDEKAIAYFTKSLELSDYIYRDAFDGLRRLCIRSGRWKLLHEYAEGVLGAIERGKHALVPVRGVVKPLPHETRTLRKRVEQALATAERYIKEEG